MSINILRSVLMAVFSLILVFPAYAGDDALQTKLCDSVTFALDFASECKTLSQCYSTSLTCIESNVVSIYEKCVQSELEYCVERIGLYAVFLENISNEYLPDAINAFESGNIEKAFSTYDAAQNSVFPLVWYDFGYGVLYFADGQYGVAIDKLTSSINLQFDNALAFYFRGKAYEALGEPYRAEQDYYTYSALTSSTLERTLPLKSFHFGFEYETWILYPLLDMFIAPSGYSYVDLSFQHQEVYWGFVNGGQTLAISNFPDLNPEINLPPILFLQQDIVESNRYTLIIDKESTGGLSAPPQIIEIVVHNDYLEYNEIVGYWESSAGRIGIIYPPSHPMPFLPENYPCRGLGRSFIRKNDRVAIYQPVDALQLYATPSLSSSRHSIPLTDEVLYQQVMDGPYCSSHEIWWYATDGQIEGWIPEAYWDSTYRQFQYVYMPTTLFEQIDMVFYEKHFPSPLEIINYGGE